MTEDIWHPINRPFWPRRTVNGSWTIGNGQVWRRKRPDGKWEYQQDEEKFEDWTDRQI